MTDVPRIQAPTAAQIDRRFRSPMVVISRPAVLAAIRGLRLARRFDWHAEGVDRLRRVDGPLILAANHVSHVDTGAILGTLPPVIRRRTAVAAALDVFGAPAQRWPRSWRRECLQFVVAAGFHAFAFDRHGPPLRSLRSSVDLIRNGWSILLYPEGTRSRNGSLGPFKGGIGVLARVTGRPVIPVHVSGGAAVLPHGVLLPRPGSITVRFGSPLRADRNTRPAEFAEQIRDQVRRLAPSSAGVGTSVATDQRPEAAGVAVSASVSTSPARRKQPA